MNINKKILDLELCSAKTLENSPKEYLEICQWAEDRSHKWTIAIFHKNSDDDYFLETVGDRVKDINWSAFGELVETGFELLQNNNKEIEPLEIGITADTTVKGLVETINCFNEKTENKINEIIEKINNLKGE